MLRKGIRQKVSLIKDSTIRFKSCKNRNNFKMFYRELATNLVKKLPVAPNKFNSGNTKGYDTDIFNNKIFECQLFKV